MPTVLIIELCALSFFVGALAAMVYLWRELSSGRRGIRMADGEVRYLRAPQHSSNGWWHRPGAHPED